jgi:hypothetical protein
VALPSKHGTQTRTSCLSYDYLGEIAIGAGKGLISKVGQHLSGADQLKEAGGSNEHKD